METEKIVDVMTGQVKVAKGKVILRARAIGSCIVIIAHDPTRNIGGLAHAMLPGSAPTDGDPGEKTKYIANAVNVMLSELIRLGAKKDDLRVALIGGGNVLKKKPDLVCQANIESAILVLKQKRIAINATALGGTERRSVSLDIESGTVFCKEADAPEKLL